MATFSVDPSALRSLADQFDSEGSPVQNILSTLRGVAASLNSVDVLGSSDIVGQYMQAHDQWAANLSQLSTSLGCIASKLDLAAEYYEQAQGANTASLTP